MSEKKESVIKRFGRKIRRIFRGELESEKRLEELRKKYEAKEKNPRYVTWEDFLLLHYWISKGYCCDKRKDQHNSVYFNPYGCISYF